ncbi:MAG: ABC transporter permease [Proteobacteria bacterium]|nr:ABC transporter permease [Pseudomonadota bacterium]
MSGSYDRPSGPPNNLPPPASPRARPREPGFSQPHTGAATAQRSQATDAYDGYDAPSAEVVSRSETPGQDDGDFDHELRADGRPGSTGKVHPGGGSAVVPAGSVTSRSLTLVVAIMCFLACLTAGGVYMVNSSASAWLRDIASEVTLQIEPRDGIDIEKSVQSASTFLARQPGIKSVHALSLEESSALVEPWLGKSDALKALPVPRLIAVEVDRTAPPDLDQLRTSIDAEFKGATLDDHRHWQAQIRTFTRSLALGGLAILMLVGAATTAIIISATRSSMASNHEIVEVLHLVGATDRYIAREFERHFLRLGVKAGLVGAGSAMAVFFLMPWVMELLGGNAVTMAELHRLFGAGVLDAAGYGVLVMVVIVIAGLCMLTSRFGVYRILDTQR